MIFKQAIAIRLSFKLFTIHVTFSDRSFPRTRLKDMHQEGGKRERERNKGKGQRKRDECISNEIN